MTSRRLLMTADAVGGVWQYATELGRALSALDYEVVLALLGPAPTDAQRQAAAGLRLVETGLPVDWLAEDEGEVRRAAQQVAALAGEVGTDVIQLNQPSLAAEPMPAPVIAVAHSCVASWWAAVKGGPLPSDFRWKTDMAAQGLAGAQAVVTPSRAFAEATRATYGLATLPEVVHNGRTPIATPNGAMHDFVFTAGRLWDEGKNLAVLDRAAARLAVPVKAAGPYEHPGGGRADFPELSLKGPMAEAELASCLAARPVFVSTALYEPFGLAVLEAAQAGCPLVLSDIPTFRELWGDVAIFVDPHDDRALADILQALVGDEAERLALGERAKAHALAFTPARMAAGMDRIYRRLAPPSKAAA
ncbi:glycosyltransferase family 4 protein [Sphingomonas sp. ID0503]|uniref:glycosyltransferase family 4 protein n=1 Tax=Sphingomonas sp. ID0503 TaxID=3399691 RepID=UPI003AFB3EF2